MNIRSLSFLSAFLCLFVCAFPPAALAQHVLQNDKARFTIGLPTYVWHPDERPGAQGWNDGWFDNAGVFADISWPVWALAQNVNLRAGLTGGVFENSIFKTSVFLAGLAEIEAYASPQWALNFGLYAGAITGYENRSVSPAAAPYIGTSYAVTQRLELGVRGFWLPGKTVAGPELAASDAFISTVTIGTRF